MRFVCPVRCAQTVLLLTAGCGPAQGLVGSFYPEGPARGLTLEFGASGVFTWDWSPACDWGMWEEGVWTVEWGVVQLAAKEGGVLEWPIPEDYGCCAMEVARVKVKTVRNGLAVTVVHIDDQTNEQTWISGEDYIDCEGYYGP